MKITVLSLEAVQEELHEMPGDFAKLGDTERQGLESCLLSIISESTQVALVAKATLADDLRWVL